MKKLILICCIGCTYLVHAQEKTFYTDLDGLVSRNQQQLVGLAQAFSEDQMNWRPAERIRSTGEALWHVAAANYFFMMSMGAKIPEDVDLVNMEKITGKANIVDAVEKSFAFLHDQVNMDKDADLNEVIKLSFGDFTRRSLLMLILEHSGEHKGQLIAYARSNGVVPPWSE
ncbi:MAG: DinB family protein [Saprospiraceae bacterium]|nr:DinB family protein [Saprospiraceae bacterium]